MIPLKEFTALLLVSSAVLITAFSKSSTTELTPTKKLRTYLEETTLVTETTTSSRSDIQFLLRSTRSTTSTNHLSYEDFEHCITINHQSTINQEDQQNEEEDEVKTINHTKISKLHRRTLLRVPWDVTQQYLTTTVNIRDADEDQHLFESYMVS